MAAVQTDEELRNARYDYQRQRASQDLNSSRQKASEAVDRRFAALGGLGSGASIKAQTNVQKNADRAGTDSRMAIDNAQNQEVQQAREVQANRDFAKSEREAGQNFQSGENATNRGFASSEREASQGFAAGEAGKNRDFSKGEREAGQKFASGERVAGQNFSSSQADIDRAFREKQYAYDTQMKDKMFDFSKSSFAQQMDLNVKNYDLEAKVQEFNMAMARAEANKKTIFQRMGDIGTQDWTQHKNGDRANWGYDAGPIPGLGGGKTGGGGIFGM